MTLDCCKTPPLIWRKKKKASAKLGDLGVGKTPGKGMNEGLERLCFLFCLQPKITVYHLLMECI